MDRCLNFLLGVAIWVSLGFRCWDLMAYVVISVSFGLLSA